MSLVGENTKVNPTQHLGRHRGGARDAGRNRGHVLLREPRLCRAVASPIWYEGARPGAG